MKYSETLLQKEWKIKRRILHFHIHIRKIYREYDKIMDKANYILTNGKK